MRELVLSGVKSVLLKDNVLVPESAVPTHCLRRPQVEVTNEQSMTRQLSYRALSRWRFVLVL